MEQLYAEILWTIHDAAAMIRFILRFRIYLPLSIFNIEAHGHYSFYFFIKTWTSFNPLFYHIFHSMSFANSQFSQGAKLSKTKCIHLILVILNKWLILCSLFPAPVPFFLFTCIWTFLFIPYSWYHYNLNAVFPAFSYQTLGWYLLICTIHHFCMLQLPDPVEEIPMLLTE